MIQTHECIAFILSSLPLVAGPHVVPSFLFIVSTYSPCPLQSIIFTLFFSLFISLNLSFFSLFGEDLLPGVFLANFLMCRVCLLFLSFHTDITFVNLNKNLIELPCSRQRSSSISYHKVPQVTVKTKKLGKVRAASWGEYLWKDTEFAEEEGKVMSF